MECTVRPKSFFDKSNKNATETNKTVAGSYTHIHTKILNYFTSAYVIDLSGRDDAELNLTIRSSVLFLEIAQ